MKVASNIAKIFHQKTLCHHFWPGLITPILPKKDVALLNLLWLESDHPQKGGTVEWSESDHLNGVAILILWLESDHLESVIINSRDPPLTHFFI
jgi:hypothetical protein